jgi:hypothetical protein
MVSLPLELCLSQGISELEEVRRKEKRSAAGNLAPVIADTDDPDQSGSKAWAASERQAEIYKIRRSFRCPISKLSVQ